MSYSEYERLGPSPQLPGWLQAVRALDVNDPPLGIKRLSETKETCVLEFAAENAAGAPAGILKCAHGSKRADNLMHEARVLKVLNAGRAAQSRVPTLLGLWKLDDATYTLQARLTGDQLDGSALSNPRVAEIVAHDLLAVIEELQAVTCDARVDSEGRRVAAWNDYLHEALRRYEGILAQRGEEAASRAVADALAIADVEGEGVCLVHRDLNPSNLFVHRSVRAIRLSLCDFGSSFFGPPTLEFVGIELFLLPYLPTARSIVRASSHKRCSRPEHQVLALATWQVARLYVSALRRQDEVSCTRLARALGDIRPSVARDDLTSYAQIESLAAAIHP